MEPKKLPLLLLVDDSQAVLDFEREVLSQAFRLDTAADGLEALEKIVSLRPDAVLLDLSMPGMDGDEVLKKMRARPDLADIPVLVISSEASRASECRRLGATDFLVKPLSEEGLRAKVGQVMEAAEEARRRRLFHYLRVDAGPGSWALPLSHVRGVYCQPLTGSLNHGAPGLREYVRLFDQSIAVLDLAYITGHPHLFPLEERKIVVVAGSSGSKLAFCVDQVGNPQGAAMADMREAASGRYTRVLKTNGEELPVLEVDQLLKRKQLARLLKTGLPSRGVLS